MKRALWVVLFAPLLPAGVVPNRYIVELSTEPVAELDPRFSDPSLPATSWADVRRMIDEL